MQIRHPHPAADAVSRKRIFHVVILPQNVSIGFIAFKRRSLFLLFPLFVHHRNDFVQLQLHYRQFYRAIKAFSVLEKRSVMITLVKPSQQLYLLCCLGISEMIINQKSVGMVRRCFLWNSKRLNIIIVYTWFFYNYCWTLILTLWWISYYFRSVEVDGGLHLYPKLVNRAITQSKFLPISFIFFLTMTLERLWTCI